MTFQRGEWIIYKLEGFPRSGTVASDENGIGVIVEDADTAVSHLVARDACCFEDDEMRRLRVELGYYAQDVR